MEEIVKHINDTNASYRTLGAGNAKNTDLFLDNEHYELFKDAGEHITVRFNKENLQKAILFIASILPRKYDNSATHETVPFSVSFVFDQMALLEAFFTHDGMTTETRTQIWNVRKDVLTNKGEIDKRFYFNGLFADVKYTNTHGEFTTAKFTIRNYLAGGYSDLHIKKNYDGIFDVWVTNVLEPYNDKKEYGYEQLYTSTFPLQQLFSESPNKDKFLPYLTALRTKPFMLLAGISGTGKSRIVRELAKACWKEEDAEYWKDKDKGIRNNNPRNFCMVQVKPNWHDSSELIGYVSRINGEKYVVGPFLRFLAKAIKDENTPYFLCLDEMNLAPVEQYFAEYLSVIESRKLNADGSITTDPIIPFEDTEAYGTLIDQLFDTEADRITYKSKDGNRLTIPQNLFVIGTVNMDETTFSFSRKVLDRAMTIEMNEVNLHGGLTDEGSEIGYIGNCIIGTAAEGKDVYSDNKELCDQVLSYLEKVNTVLEGTPFKIAYRTRNEFLLYAVNRQLLDKDSQLWQTLDEMTSMKILSRIEGDSERTKTVLEGLKALVEIEITQTIPESEEGEEKLKSITAAKIEEMLGKLKVSGYTSYWA